MDYNQNARDHTIASAYSVRGVPEATVSTPITWAEVDDVAPGDCTIATVPGRFAALGDLHAGIDDAVFSPRPAAGVGRPGRARGSAGPRRPGRRHGRGAIALISSYAACEAAIPVTSAWS